MLDLKIILVKIKVDKDKVDIKMIGSYVAIKMGISKGD